MKPDLYAKADGNRKPWYIAALVYHEGTEREERFVTILHNPNDDSWLASYRKSRGLDDCHYYIAEGYYNIVG